MTEHRGVHRLEVLKSHLSNTVCSNGLDVRSTSRSFKYIERYIDLRSDTVTKPTQEMRQAMHDCPVGDDVYGDDPTMNKLQELAAKFLGKEDALFVPTGTMGNLISVMAHCEARNSEMILGDMCHIHLYEAGGSARFGGIHSRVIRNNSDGTMDLDDIESLINPDEGNPHFAMTQLICLENTHNRAGGAVVPLDYMEKVRKLADKYDLRVHLDGARICNAAIQLGVHPSRVARDADTVNMCFSKGLASPVGSIIAGSRDFIRKARTLRKALGGGLRQSGVLAACAIISIEKMYPLLVQDHKNATTLAKGLGELKFISVLPFDTNILFIDVDCDQLTSVKNGGDLVRDMMKNGILANNTKANVIRLVCHYEVTEDDIQQTLNYFRNLK